MSTVWLVILVIGAGMVAIGVIQFMNSVEDKLDRIISLLERQTPQYDLTSVDVGAVRHAAKYVAPASKEDA